MGKPSYNLTPEQEQILSELRDKLRNKLIKNKEENKKYDLVNKYNFSEEEQ